MNYASNITVTYAKFYCVVIISSAFLVDDGTHFQTVFKSTSYMVGSLTRFH